MANQFRLCPDDIFLVARYADDGEVIFMRVSHTGEKAFHKTRDLASEFTGEECAAIFADAETKRIRGLISIRVV